ncbi:gpW family protein [Paraburkholderia adhaesiva]|uniref:gpW family protein n=1 Tax=Paraburkholderia adhaesiva TaxID=2883244 RepID=UPI001F48A2D0|nr:gpW family protein [Paraburkholderia adhaesiva]
MAVCRCTGVLDGVPLATLRAQLASMQAAYLALMTGSKAESASYTQADGSRSITFTRANVGDLVQGIIGVQVQIAKLTGQCCNRRPPVVPFF